MRDPQLVETPHLYPGTCVDGRQDGPVADTFLEPPGYGRLYLSRNMVRDCARVFPTLVRELALESGYVPQSEHMALVSSLQERLELAQADVAALERIRLADVRSLAGAAA